MHGIDLSNNNDGTGPLDGVEFAWLKVSEGVDFVDSKFGGFAADCELAGIPYGGYHFAHPDAHDPAAEAQWFLDHYDPRGRWPAALDLEPRGQGAGRRDPLVIMGARALAQWADGWCGIVAAAIEVDPVQYMDRDYASQLAPFSARWPLWLATLDGSTPTQYGGRTVAAVQYTEADGIDQNQSFTLTLGGTFMALTDAEQAELLAIVRAMGQENYQAAGMSLQWLDDKLDERLALATPKVAEAVAGLIGHGGATGTVEVSGQLTFAEPAGGPQTATAAASEPPSAPAPTAELVAEPAAAEPAAGPVAEPAPAAPAEPPSP